MKRFSLIVSIVILVGIVGIGSIFLLLFNRDPVLTKSHGPTRATHSLRARFENLDADITKQPLELTEQSTEQPDRLVDVIETTDVVPEPPLLPDEIVSPLEPVAKESPLKDTAVPYGAPLPHLPSDPPPALAVGEESAEEEPKIAGVVADTLETNAPAELSAEAFKPIVQAPPIVEVEENRRYYSAQIQLSQSVDGSEMFPYLKRYQSHSYRLGCAVEDTRITKGDAVRLFKRALQFGGMCEQTALSADVRIMFESIYAVFAEHKPKFFVQYSGGEVTGSIAHIVSFTWSWLPVFFHRLPSTSSPTAATLGPDQRNENLLYCHSSLPSNVITVNGVNSASASEQMDCFQFIETYEDFVESMLPFEFEEHLGRAICHCHVTWLPINLPPSAYFTAWGNSTDMLAAAMLTVVKECNYTVQVPLKIGYAGKNKQIAASDTHMRVTRHSFKDNLQSQPPTTGVVQSSAFGSSRSPIYFNKRSNQSPAIDVTNKLSSHDASDTSKVDQNDINNNVMTFQDVLRLDLSVDSKVSLLSSFASSLESIECNEYKRILTDNSIDFTYTGPDGRLRSLPKLYIGLNGEITNRKDSAEAKFSSPLHPIEYQTRSNHSNDHIGSEIAAAGAEKGRAGLGSATTSTIGSDNAINTSPSVPVEGVTRRLLVASQNNIGSLSSGVHAGTVVTQSPTRKPTGAVASSVKSISATLMSSRANTIVDDIEKSFGTSGILQPNGLSTLGSTTPQLQDSNGNIKRGKDSVIPDTYFSEWLFTGETSTLQKNIMRSISEKKGLFDDWLATRYSSQNRSRGRFAEASIGVGSSINEMSLFGRMSMKDLRDRERPYLKKWISAIYSSLMTKSGKGIDSSLNFFGPTDQMSMSVNDPVKEASSMDRALLSSLKKSKLAKSELIMVFGRRISLLSIKLAQIQRSSGTVISVHTETTSIGSHSDLITMFGLGNRNIVCLNKMEVLDVVALAGSTELSAVSIYQVDVIIRLLSNSLTSLFSETLPSSPSSESIGDDDLFGNGESGTYPQSDNDSKSRCNVALSLFEECIGVLIDISKTSYIELPSLERLAVSVHVINPQCDDVFIQRYAFLDDIISKSISTLSHHEGVMTITELPHDGTGVPVVFTVARSVKDTTAKPAVGISLYRLLHLHPSAKILKDLIKLFLDMPFWLLKSEKAKIMLPWNLLVSYRPEKGSLSINYRFDDASADVNTFELQHNHDVENSAFRNNKKSIFGIQYGRSMDWTTSASEKDDAAIAIFEKTRSHFMFDIISEELASKPGDTAAGKFSFVEHNSGYGFLSALVSEAYPNATVISLESDDNAVSHHVEMLEHLSLHNNAVCKKRKGEDSLMYKNLYESPELFRFQVMSQGFLESFRDADNLFRWGADTGSLLSTALTTFINLPTSEIASLSMHLFFGSFDKSTDGFGRGPIRPLKELFGEETSGFLARDVRDVSDIFQTANLNIGGNLDGKQCKAHSNLQVSSRKVIMDDVGDKLHVWGHPSRLFEEFESSLLLIHSRALAGNTKVKFNTLYYGESKLKSPMIRVDIINMTRGVHHHYDYAKDGHKRTYTMRVMVNETQTSEIFSLYGSPSKAASVPTRNEIKLVFYSNGLSNTMSLPLGSHPNADSIVTVNLMRASTIPFYIPYTSIYGVTLITALRLGLETSQRDKMFSSFINLPLYEDMAPWNIVLMGQGLDYIDYDTRDITFDKFVPKAYQVMAVLMNYKRTVEDFKRCGAKASTVYGIAFISDCVGNVKGLKCEELSHAVPCPDGECHTDYISCLRSLTYQASKISDEGSTDSVLSEMVAAMASQTGQFDENGMVIH